MTYNQTVKIPHLWPFVTVCVQYYQLLEKANLLGRSRNLISKIFNSFNLTELNIVVFQYILSHLVCF